LNVDFQPHKNVYVVEVTLGYIALCGRLNIDGFTNFVASEVSFMILCKMGASEENSNDSSVNRFCNDSVWRNKCDFIMLDRIVIHNEIVVIIKLATWSNSNSAKSAIGTECNAVLFAVVKRLAVRLQLVILWENCGSAVKTSDLRAVSWFGDILRYIIAMLVELSNLKENIQNTVNSLVMYIMAMLVELSNL
jgi:hypothetical protein